MIELVNIIQYPLVNDWAEFTLGLESIIIFVSFQWFAYFLGRFVFYRQHLNNTTIKRNLAWSFLILGFGIAFLIFVYADYNLGMQKREEINLWGYLAISSGGFVFFAISERIHAKKYIPFTGISFVLVIIVIVAISLSLTNVLVIVGSIGGSITLLYTFLYRKVLLKTTNYNMKVRFRIDMLITGFVLITVGFGLFSDEVINLFGFVARIAADILLLIGILLSVIILQRVPDYAELDWYGKLKTLLVMNDSGTCICSWNFFEKEKSGRSNAIISGAIKSVEAILKEGTKTKIVKQVEMGKGVFLFEEREKLTFVIVAEERMEAIRLRLGQFANKFSKNFKDVLQKWDGNLDVFYPADNIIEEIFSPL